MTKTVKEIADEIGVSKTAIRNKMTDDFRAKWVQTSTANGVQTLVVSDEGVNALKSMFDSGKSTANLGANMVQTSLHLNDFYEKQLSKQSEQIESLQKLLNQSQQLLLNEQKKSQLLIESNSSNSLSEEQKNSMQNTILNYRKTNSDLQRQASELSESVDNAARWFWVASALALVFFITTLVLVITRLI